MTLPVPPKLSPVPPTLNYAAGPDRTFLRLVASQQRNIMLCILIYFGGVLVQFLLPEPFRPILGLAVLAVSVFALVCVFRIATRLYKTWVGVLLGITCLIPLLGLVSLLIVNGKATTVLRQHGLKVGLLGADPKAVIVCRPEAGGREATNPSGTRHAGR